MKEIFRTGLIYTKAGVVVTGIIPADQITVHLSDKTDRARLNEVSRLMDNINRHYGRNTIVFAAQNTQHKWQTKADRKSPSYTTQWDDIQQVLLD